MAGKTNSSSEGKGAGGRPTTYTPELGDIICGKLAEGKSLKRITKSKSMPARSTVYKWLREHEEFSDNYVRAKDDSADSYADDIADIADRVLSTGEDKIDPQAARVAIDGKKWAASKLKPKKYGDKLDLTTDGDKLNRGASIDELDAIIARAAAATSKASSDTET